MIILEIKQQMIVGLNYMWNALYDCNVQMYRRSVNKYWSYCMNNVNLKTHDLKQKYVSLYKNTIV